MSGGKLVGMAFLILIGFMVADAFNLFAWDMERPDLQFTFLQPATFWFLAAIVLIIAIRAFPKWWKTVPVLALLLLAGVAFDKYIDREVNEKLACWNLGDCSERSDYIRTVSNGTVVMKQEQSDHFYVDGRVKIVNNVDYSCLGYTPEERFNVRSENNGRLNYFTTKSGRKELLVIRVKMGDECRNRPT